MMMQAADPYRCACERRKDLRNMCYRPDLGLPNADLNLFGLGSPHLSHSAFRRSLLLLKHACVKHVLCQSCLREKEKERLPFGSINILSPFGNGDNSSTGWADCGGCPAGSLGELWGHGDQPSSPSLQASVFSYPHTRQRSRPVMASRWTFMCLKKDAFWTIRSNWVAVCTLNPNLTTAFACWPRRNRAEGPLCCPDWMIPHHPCICQGGMCA